MSHPMLDLLELTGLDAMLDKSNFVFFSKLKKALEADCQTTTDDECSARPFQTPIANTVDLFDNHIKVLHAMIDEWSMSVMNPLIEQLNEYGDNTADLSLMFDGYLDNPTLAFEGNPDWATDFAAGVDADDVGYIKDVLEDWKNSIKMIANIDQLTAALDAIVTEEE